MHNVPIGLKLWPSAPAFNLLAGKTDKKFNVKILEAKLRLCHVTLDTGVVYAISEALKVQPANYPFVSSKCRTFTIPKGSQNATFTDIFTSNTCPDHLILTLIKSVNFSGSYHANPFVYENASLSEIGFYVNNTSLPSKPLQLKFGDSAYSSHYIEAYQRICRENPNTIITFEDFHRGYSIFLFDLTNREHSDLLPVSHTGTSKLELRFSKATEDTLVAFVYGKFKSVVNIDSTRNLTVE